MDISMDISMDIHMDMSMDIHMDMSMDTHMEMPIKSKVSKLDGSCTDRSRGLCHNGVPLV